MHDPDDTIREYKLTEEQREKLEELRPHEHKEGDMKEKIKKELKGTQKGQELEEGDKSYHGTPTGNMCSYKVL